MVVNSGDDLLTSVERVSNMAEGSIVHLFVRLQWHGSVSLDRLARLVAQAASSHPNLRFTFMTATSQDDILYRNKGLDSIWCNHNAFLDARIYTPDLNAEKLYDAVYVARLVQFKRHQLAVEIPRLAVITEDFKVEPDYASTCLAAYHDLRFVNYDPELGCRRLTPEQVRSVLTQSRCGLALSEVEGAMFASAEYLLTGLPVVTTPSKGGRHIFFHPDYVELVEATPESVASGVARLIARNIDPEMIRSRTYKLFMEHRSRLIMRLSGLAQKDLFAQAGPNLWLPQFVNKLETWVKTES